MFETANYIEAVFWTAVGLAFIVWAALAGRRKTGLPDADRKPKRTQGLAAGATFILFGATDVIEAGTGAWWRPWWLFAWKAACLLILLAFLVQHLRHRPRQAP